MKEVKAFIRCDKAEEVMEALEQTGEKNVTLIDVMGVGSLADPHTAKYSIECVKKFSDVAKIELICRDEDVKSIVDIIRRKAYTGMKGDGMIYTTPVEHFVEIRSEI
ncbi:MAG TPA: P-II family nitrogen regulator [Balneolales bacterium]|nr:P-II family nitrogen regulator [Balneolales bacterium]